MGHRDDPRTKYIEARDRLDRAARGELKSGSGSGGALASEVDPENAELAVEVLDALDPEKHTAPFRHDGKTKTLAYNTLQNYATRLRLIAGELDQSFLKLDNDGINALIADLANGETDLGPSDGYAKGTIGQYQSALKALYRYHDGHDVNPETIPVEAPEKTSVDERDMFTPEEVRAMRQVIDSRRNRALFEVLAYTGQRIRVIQTLRVKDVDPGEGATGAYYVNTEADGRKNREGKGPLLGAKEYVRRWLDVHPTGEPTDALFTALPSNGGGGDVGEPLTQDSIRYALESIADRADVDKDVNPHIFRHYFTTVAKRDYDMDDAYIKRLRGDALGSNVMETTYRHLSDDDTVEHAEAKFTGEEPETVETAHTPDGPCPSCGKILESDAKACPRCGAVFTPDAVDAQRTIQQDIGADMALADGAELTEEQIEEIASDDAILAKLIEIRSAG